MNIPENIAAALAAADDEYLVGLSNKGTVNRGRKDAAALTQWQAEPDGDDLLVTMGPIQCRIKVPLGQSACTCPSSGMCRHRIAAMLLLREQAGRVEPAKREFEALRDYPAEKLIKILGRKRVEAALFRYESGGGPVLTEGSVITMELPWIPATVRLLEPLEHSTCSCHSKSFCVHKAEALLFWKLARKAVEPTALREAEPDVFQDPEQVRGICRSVQEILSAQMTTGLSRMPASVCDTVERMASLCHTARLPDLERTLRRVHGEYAAYFARSAAFRDTALLAALSRAFRLASALESAQPEQMSRLAGAFREAYQAVEKLKLYLLGYRNFTGRGGYAGVIYYFCAPDQKQFYTFSDLRPTFYDGKSGRKGTSAVPWGLPCPLKQAWKTNLDLRGAKASAGGNLSATEQCQATLLDRCAPGMVIGEDMVIREFDRLLTHYSQPGTGERERLALVAPHRCRAVPYDRVRQVFAMELQDRDGRDLRLEAAYSKEEAPVVEQLEALAQQLEKDPQLRPVFLGIVYRDGDRLKMYPIEYFTNWEGEA